jgi:uncharacterized protein (DUF1015 family)
MARIFPFAAYRYDSRRVALEKVLTQPYDKITPEMQQRYYAADPHNLIAVEKGLAAPDDSPGNNVYTRAAAKLEEWIALGILVREPRPAIYAYFQDYAVPGSSERHERRGFIALCQLEDYEAGVVYRHERTLHGPKADRLELLRRTRAQTGQLFMLYDDPTGRIDALLERATRAPAPDDVRDEYGVRHRLWPITDEKVVSEIVAAMAPQKLVIADGHHRYETALAYRDECRAAGRSAPDAPHERAMMTLVNARSPGLTILPTHRVVSRLGQFRFEDFRARLVMHFECESFAFSGQQERPAALARFRQSLAERGQQRSAIGVYAGGGAFHLFVLREEADLAALLPEATADERRLDVVVLHQLLLERGLGISAEAVSREQHLAYEREFEAALAAVDEGRAQLACLINPVRIEQVMRIALAGGVLPQKSTDFYPKMLSGLAIYRLED